MIARANLELSLIGRDPRQGAPGVKVNSTNWGNAVDKNHPNGMHYNSGGVGDHGTAEFLPCEQRYSDHVSRIRFDCPTPLPSPQARQLLCPQHPEINSVVENMGCHTAANGAATHTDREKAGATTIPLLLSDSV